MVLLAGDQLETHAVRVVERQHFSSKTRLDLTGLHAHAFQVRLPERRGLASNAVSDPGCLAAARTPAFYLAPGEEGQNRSGCADPIAIIEMVGPGVVEVDRRLDQALSQHLLVKVQIGLRVVGDGGDMV